MFFPSLPGVQIIDVSDEGLSDPINSATEFINQVLLGHKDSTPEKETSKHHRFVHAPKVRACVFYQPIAFPESKTFIPDIAKLDYILRHDNIGPSLSYDIVAPPPKAA